MSQLWLYHVTTSIQGPLGRVPIVALPCDHLYSRTTWSCPDCGFTMRPPLFKDHLVVSRLWLYHAATSIQGPLGRVPIVALPCGHLYSRTTWSCPDCGFTMRPPLFKDHLVVSRLWLYHATTSIQGPLGRVPIVALPCDHLYSRTTLFLAQAWSLNTSFTVIRKVHSIVQH